MSSRSPRCRRSSTTPANIFVAGFIGVPQMNFFDAQLVRLGDGFTVKTEDMNVALAPETCAQLALNWTAAT